MANMINYLSLTGLSKYDLKIKEFIAAKVAEGDAPSFKYVDLKDGALKFYNVNPITEYTEPIFEIELPEQDLSHLMVLVEGAVSGNVAVFPRSVAPHSLKRFTYFTLSSHGWGFTSFLRI